jgi:hypothetical protein
MASLRRLPPAQPCLVTTQDPYPLPNIQDLLSRLHGCRIFSWYYFAILGADFLKHFNLIIDLAADQIQDAVLLQRTHGRYGCNVSCHTLRN